MDDLIGRSLGPFRIDEQIGQGGMATVYKAYQPAVDRSVALKVLPGHLQQDPAFVQRFEREARVIARLEHAHILPVYDFGIDGDVSYIAMRYLTGGTLKDLLIAQGKLPLAQISHVLLQICDALDYAHSQGVVHRDVKPSNVMLDARGECFLTDFGIAKMVASETQVTGTGIIGTPAYMSPEQALGGKIDGRSDIYSLGVMLYEMLAGRVPYDAETPMGVIMKHIHAPLPDVLALRPDLPPALAAVVTRAMAKDPEDRFPTANDMARALAGALGIVLPVPAPPVTAGAPASVPAAPAATAEDGPTLTTPPEGAAARAPVAGPAAGTPATERREAPVATELQAPARPRWSRRQVLLAAGACVVLLAGLWAGFNRWGGPGPAPGTAIPAGTPLGPSTSALGGRWQNYGDLNRVLALAGGDRYVWSTGPAGLVRWDAQTGAPLALTAADGLPANDLTDVLVAHDGAIWVATRAHGVFCLGTDARTLERFSPGDLHGTAVSRLFEDDQHTLWAFGSSATAPVQRFKPGVGWQAVQLPNLNFQLPAIRDVYVEPGGASYWLATDGAGLLRVQGATLRRFGLLDGLPSEQVNALAPAADGKSLWVGTAAGVALVQGEEVVVASNEAVAAFAATAIRYDGDGVLWIGGTTGVYRLDTALVQWRRYGLADGLPDEGVTALGLGPDGTIWAGTGAGVAHFDGERWRAYAVPDRPPMGRMTQILPWQGSLLLFSPGDRSLLQVDPDGPRFTQVVTLSAALVARQAIALAAAPDGTLYAGTAQGVLRLDPGTAKATYLTGMPAPADVRALAVAHDGSLWVGTSSRPRRYLDRVWTEYRGGVLPNKPVVAFAATADGAVWAAWDSGVGRMVEDHWTVWEQGTPTGIPEGSGEIVALAADSQDRAWAGTRGGNVVQFARGRWTLLGAPGASASVLSLAPGAGGTIWAGLDGGGLARYDGQAWQSVTAADGLGDDVVPALYAAPAGDVWCATGAGIAHWTP